MTTASSYLRVYAGGTWISSTSLTALERMLRDHYQEALTIPDEVVTVNLAAPTLELDKLKGWTKYKGNITCLSRFKLLGRAYEIVERKERLSCAPAAK